MATYGGVHFLNFLNSVTKKWTFSHHKIPKIVREKKFHYFLNFMMAKSPLFSGQIKKVKKVDPP